MTAEGREPGRVLTEEILDDARRQAGRIVARAGREAAEITAKAQARADEQREQRIEAARDEAERRRRLTLARLPVEAGRMRAEKVEAALQSVHDEARERLLRREGFDYREAVAALAAEAAKRLEGEAIVLELAEADRGALGAALADDVRRRVGRDGLDISVAPEPADIAGGVIVRDIEGRQVWDNSLLGRLRRFWPMLRREIAARMALDEADAGDPAPDAQRKES